MKEPSAKTRPGKPAKKPTREERLAAALRANLRRRKAPQLTNAKPGDTK